MDRKPIIVCEMTNMRPQKRGKKAIFYRIYYFGWHEGSCSEVSQRHSRSEKVAMGLRNTLTKFHENMIYTHENNP